MCFYINYKVYLLQINKYKVNIIFYLFYLYLLNKNNKFFIKIN
jgi:hypothetical protein